MSGEQVKPIFGPNGAVMNAPTMTPEMRAKFDRPNYLDRSEMRHLVLVVVAVVALVALGWPVHAFLSASPWWSGALTGFVAAISLRMLWQFALTALKRWELRGSVERVLGMPMWSRVLLAASDIGRGACIAALVIAHVAELNGELWGARIWATVALVAFAMFGWFMRWLGDELKWSWRLPVS
jgi:hypothetical protein